MKRMSPARAIAYGLPAWQRFLHLPCLRHMACIFLQILSDCQEIRGLIMTIGTLWDAVTDPLVGIISDNRDPRKGEEDRFY